MLSYNCEAPALGRGQMGHALRVTEAGATPQKPWRTVRQRVGSLPPHLNSATSLRASSSRV